MKKILSLMLVAIMLISLFACGKQNENTSGTTESTASDTTSDRIPPDATTSTSETTTETQATTETTSQEWKYKEVPYAEESYYKLFLNGKEISGYKILIYQTSESIYPERAIVADGEAMFVTKHMLDHDDEIPTYEYKAGDKFDQRDFIEPLKAIGVECVSIEADVIDFPADAAEAYKILRPLAED